jgi:6-phosphogluconolactonase
MPMASALRIYKSPQTLADAAADEIVRVIERAIQDRNICLLVLSGGETPRPVYRLLGSPPLKDQVKWQHVHLLFGDERAVSPDDPKSNFRMVHQDLISHIVIPSGNVHRIAGEMNPAAAAQDYSDLLKKLFSQVQQRPDMVLLGLGNDGHTASLFPGTPAVREDDEFVRAVFVPQLNSWRVTLTLSVINSARTVLFLVSGEPKASVVQKILDLKAPSAHLPASMVRPTDGRLLWMIDEAAASLLRELK